MKINENQRKSMKIMDFHRKSKTLNLLQMVCNVFLKRFLVSFRLKTRYTIVCRVENILYGNPSGSEFSRFCDTSSKIQEILENQRKIWIFTENKFFQFRLKWFVMCS